MKKIIKQFSFIGIGIATALLIIGLSISINSNKSAVVFEYFPFNEPQNINFQVNADSFQNFTKRQKKDQFLDWLLFTVQSDPSFSTKEITESLYDISPVRYDYLKPVSNFEYGKTRSLYVGNETIVALIPQNSSPKQRNDYLAHIADKHRQNLGRIPEKLEVFEYKLDLEKETAELTRVEELNTINLFQDKQYGYHQTYIRNLNDLNQLMAKVDDITFAQVNNSALVVGGRKILSHSYGKISVEDVATLWQSEQKIKKEIKQLQNDVTIQNLLNTQLLSQKELEKKIIQDFQKESRKRKIVDGSGFSLDHTYDYQGLKKSLSRVTPWILALKSNGTSIFSKQEIEQIQKSLSQKKIVLYLQLIKKLRSIDLRLDETEIIEFLKTPITKGFQVARYDGDLQGTEVGMVLFYTDLLAKLWMFNYLGTIPEKYIPDFQSKTQIAEKVSPIYKHEIQKLPYTRLWFAPQDKGFQIADNGNSLLLARNASRIFAASSNPLKPDEETTAVASSEAFLGWWNEHYEEIARYEPQYERLNEIMKWSLVVSWLNRYEQGELLGFLKGVQVNRDHWFPDWIENKVKKLKFKQWDTKSCSEAFYFYTNFWKPKVCFYPRGYKGRTTEAMPLLRSESFMRFNEKRIFYGGVSLTNLDIFRKRIPLPEVSKISDRSLRSNIDHNTLDVHNGNIFLKNLDGTSYNLKNIPSHTSVIIRARYGAKLRDLDSELIKTKVLRQISRTDDGITIKTLASNTNIGTFSSSKIGNAFTVGWRSQDLDIGQSLALELSSYSSQDNLEKLLKNHPKVNFVAKEKNSSIYYLKTDNSEKWLKLSSGGGGSKIPPAYIFRVAAAEPSNNRNSRPLLLNWVDDLQDLELQVIFSSSKSRHSDIFEDTRNGDFISAAPEIIKQKKFNKSLTEINSLMKSQKYKEAARLIDDSINKFGKEADLMIRKAVVNLKLKNLKVEAASIEGLKAPQNSDFIEEINEILKNQDEGKFKAIRKSDALIYVQDIPELNNIDWGNPIENSIPYISSKTRVYKLQEGDIGNIKLTNLGFDGTFLGNTENLQLNSLKSKSSEYNEFNAGNFSLMRRSIAIRDDKCQNTREDRIKDIECEIEENNVYVMYLAD